MTEPTKENPKINAFRRMKRKNELTGKNKVPKIS